MPKQEFNKVHTWSYLIRQSQNRYQTMFIVRKKEERIVSTKSCFQLMFLGFGDLTRELS